MCDERLFHIIADIKSGDYDVVVLQEVWQSADREFFLGEAAKVGLTFHRVFHPGIGIPVPLGSGSTGMVMLSRYPILETMYKQYDVNGKPLKFHHADFYGAKGIGFARILTPCGQVDLFTSHLHAAYEFSLTNDEYYATRVAQSLSLAKFIHLVARSPLVILLGDLNETSDSLCHRALLYITKFRDAFLELNPGNPGHTIGTEDNDLLKGDEAFWAATEAAQWHS
jgi:sphingomyelin phosphodiesterase 2